MGSVEEEMGMNTCDKQVGDGNATPHSLTACLPSFWTGLQTALTRNVTITLSNSTFPPLLLVHAYTTLACISVILLNNTCIHSKQSAAPSRILPHVLYPRELAG
eukprot:1159127-Pelagomonas_calceolata.AAC.3